MKLPNAVIDKLQDSESPVTHAVTIEGGSMIVRYTCDGKAIGQTMFHYTTRTYVDWFHSMIKEMNPGGSGGAKENKVKTKKKARACARLSITSAAFSKA